MTSDESASDDDLMRLSAGGEAEAFDVLFDRYADEVHGFALAMLGDVEAAREVLQETFLKVIEHRQSYEPRGRFKPWLMRIAGNLCRNRLRAHRMREAMLQQVNLIKPSSAHNGDAFAAVAGREEVRRIIEAIRNLSDDQQQAILLRAMHAMSYEAIAETMDVPIGTVKTLIHRARATLAARLGASDDDASGM